MGKDLRLSLEDERCEDDGGDDEDDDGEAGSAAARARKTAWVPRDRSVEFGFARRARAYRTFLISFFLIDASKVSVGVEKCDSAEEIGETNSFSEYLAVINRSRSSRDDIGVGLTLGPKVASQTMLLTRLPMSISSSIVSCVKEMVSSVSDRILEMCVPSER